MNKVDNPKSSAINATGADAPQSGNERAPATNSALSSSTSPTQTPAASADTNPDGMNKADAQSNARYQRRMHAYALAGIGLLGLALVAAWFWGKPIWQLLTNEQAVEALVERAGVWGPLALIIINIVQIIIAPIPGYVVQLAAGYLYGPLWGGIFASVGMMAGSMLAMFLARTFGRPLALWMLGTDRIQRWEIVTHSDSVLVWLLLLAAPIGDSVFLLAGLSRVSYLTVFLIAMTLRVPSVFLSTAIGGGAVPGVWLAVLVVIFGALTAFAYRNREPISTWFERTVKHRAADSIPVLLPAVPEGAAEESAPESTHP